MKKPTTDIDTIMLSSSSGELDFAKSRLNTSPLHIHYCAPINANSAEGEAQKTICEYELARTRVPVVDRLSAQNAAPTISRIYPKRRRNVLPISMGVCLSLILSLMMITKSSGGVDAFQYTNIGNSNMISRRNALVGKQLLSIVPNDTSTYLKASRENNQIATSVSTKSGRSAKNTEIQTSDIQKLQLIHEEVRKRMSMPPKDINTVQIRQLVDHMVRISDLATQKNRDKNPSNRKQKVANGVSSFKTIKKSRGEEEKMKLVQDTFRLVTQRAFSSSSWNLVQLGLLAMERQSKVTGIPQSVCIQALKALNVLMRRRNNKSNTSTNGNDDVRHKQASAAFRVLQRMCTGVGLQSNSSDVRDFHQVYHTNREPDRNLILTNRPKMDLDERDFSMVLNGFVNIADMTMAHRVVGLQMRTDHAPALSPVIYSILIKGYGSLRQTDSVDKVLDQAQKNRVEPDIVMYNSLIDAYINCDHVPKAHAVFQDLTTPKSKPKPKQHHNALEEQEDQEIVTPAPNLRTYNTMLKGFVKAENLEMALSLSRDMERVKLWDAVTTNTLVGVAVATKHFDTAESILEKYTVSPDSVSTSLSRNKNNRRRQSKQNRWHPNVEAYTELIGGYAKNGKLKKALETFKAMRVRGVNPNEYTYTSIIGALAKAQKTKQAKKLLMHMTEVDNIRPSVVTYNAFIAGMLMSDKFEVIGNAVEHERTGSFDDELHLAFNDSIDDALEILEGMLSAGVSPNAITISTLVDSLGRNKPSRIDEAKALVDRMHVARFVSKSNARVSTNLIRACARSSDLEGSLTAYRGIRKPDVIAFNALLNAFCENNRVKMAIEILNANLKKKKKGDCITPDVATYTILISSMLQIGSTASSNGAYSLYKEMRAEWDIIPDTGLIDS